MKYCNIISRYLLLKRVCKLYFIILLVIFTFQLNAQTDTFYVNIKATGNNNGTSWKNAFTGLNKPLEIASYGDEIWVAKGEYQAQDSIAFEIKISIKIYGGFAGNETSITQRDWKNNETIIKGGGGYEFLYKSNALFIQNTDTTAFLDGITIKDGFAKMFIPDDPLPGDTFYTCESNPNKYRACHGGGIYMLSESIDKPVFLNIYNCKFTNNRAYEGGAIGIDAYFGRGGVNINNCIFTKNFADIRGAISLEFGPDNNLNSKITNTIFDDNYGKFSSGSIGYQSYSSDGRLLLENLVFINNSSGRNIAGAFYNLNVNPKGTVIKNCVFKDNYCWNGIISGSGGAYYGAFASFENCRFSNNTANFGGAIYGASNSFLNCIFDINHAFKNGGAIFNDGKGSINTNSFVNCNFFGNHADQIGGAIFNLEGQELLIYNSIFENNKADTSADHIFSDYLNTSIHLANIMVDESELDSVLILYQNGPGDLVEMDSATIFLDSPIFWDTAKGDYRLAYCSPAREAGDKKWTEFYDIDLDIENTNRIKGSHPDLGAYEMDSNITFDSLITHPSSKTSTDGEIIISNLEGLKPPLQFMWNNGVSDSINAKLNVGIYSLIVKDDLECIDTFYFKLESTTSSHKINSINDLKLYPNIINTSSTSLLTCNSDKVRELSVAIADVSGKILIKQNWQLTVGTNNLELTGLTPGSYFLIVKGETGEAIALKLIVL